MYSGFDASDSGRIHEYFGRSVEGLKNEEEYYRGAEENTERSCEIARSGRCIFISIATVASVDLLLAVPKPKRVRQSERNDSESGPNDPGNAGGPGNAGTGGA